MRRFAIVVGFLTLSGLACAGRNEPLILKAASRQLSCPESKIKLDNTRSGGAMKLKYKLAGADDPQYLARGCGKQDTYVRFCSDDDSSTCKWRSVDAIQSKELRERAAFDLDCDAGSLEFVKLDDRSRGVKGCGYRMTYVWNCPHDPAIYTTKCSWILNSSSKLLSPQPN